MHLRETAGSNGIGFSRVFSARRAAVLPLVCASIGAMVACGPKVPRIPGAPGAGKIIATLDAQAKEGDRLVAIGPYLTPFLKYAKPEVRSYVANPEGDVKSGATLWLALPTSQTVQYFPNHPFQTVPIEGSEGKYLLEKLVLRDVEEVTVPGGEFEPTTGPFFMPKFVYRPEKATGFDRWCGYGRYKITKAIAASGKGSLWMETGARRKDDGTSAALFSHVMSPPIPFPERALAFVSVKYKGPRYRPAVGFTLIWAKCLVRRGNTLVAVDVSKKMVPVFSAPPQSGEWQTRSVIFETPPGTESLLIRLRSAGRIGDRCHFDKVRLFRIK